MAKITLPLHEYNSSAISFYKYAKDKVDVDYFTTPKALVEQRSGDWFAPLLLVTLETLRANPELTSILCGVIANYITDFFKGIKKPKLKIKIIIAETDKSKSTEISYEGSDEGIKELKDTIDKIIERK